MGTTRLVTESAGISPEAEFRDQVIRTVGMSGSGDLAAEDLNYDGTIILGEIHQGDLAPLFRDDSLVPGSESSLRLGREGTQRLLELARNVFSSSAVELPAVDVAVVTRATATDASLDNGFLRIRHHGEIDMIGRWRRRWYERFEQGFRKTFVRGESAASDRLLHLCRPEEESENGSGGAGRRP